MKIAYLFPGQGSQKKGMGKEVFDLFPELVEKANTILGYSIVELCVEDPKGVLGQTQYTQPALFIVSALTYLKKIKETGGKPDFVVGHSLGEYSALFASGVIDFEMGIKLVQRRGLLMSQVTGGGMVAVKDFGEEQLRSILKKHHLEEIDVANLNAPSQVVLSGPHEILTKLNGVFKKEGVTGYMSLAVSAAFHSRYMQPVAKEYGIFLEQHQFNEPKIPIIANVTARPYQRGEIKKLLVEQITHSVKWTESIRYLMGKGVDSFEEIGVGNVLTKLVEKIRKDSTPLVVLDENPIKEGEKASFDSTSSPTIAIKHLKAEELGNKEFKKDYNLKYAYLCGGMYKGVSSKEMVVRLGKKGMMGFLGTGGVSLEQIEEDIGYIRQNLKMGEAYGVNLLHNIVNPQEEEKQVDIFIKHNVRNIEAAAFMQMTPALVRYRLQGLHRNKTGEIVIDNRIMGKISRPEIAEMFLSPAPEKIVAKLKQEGKITEEQAELAKVVPMADDLCVEADSAGHTDQGAAYVLTPAIMRLREEMIKKYGYQKRIRVGAAGGIGTPEAAAAAFIMGADFILTGSINQCTVEAGTSDAVKEILQGIQVQDTTYAPAGDMFELGAKVQVVKKGIFFPARANKLYELYKQFNSLEEIDEKTKTQIQEKYFKRSFAEVWKDCEEYYSKTLPDELGKARQNPKTKMALIFRWYFGYSTKLALTGSNESKVDYQIYSGPALGAFNQWVKGTELENWQNRHVDTIGEKLMEGTAILLSERLKNLMGLNVSKGYEE